jgi:hypothetical protein
MYDPITNRFRLSCPTLDRAVDVPVSRFRTVERLPGPGHPPVHRVEFACSACKGEHPALVPETELDLRPLEPQADAAFLNLQTGRLQPLAEEFTDLAQRHLRRGNWPWTFYCASERRVRPGYPSRLRLLQPSDDRDLVGVAVRCAACSRISLNLVSERHLDQPFFHDRVLRYVDSSYDGRLETMAQFREELWSGRFDEERNRYAA